MMDTAIQQQTDSNGQTIVTHNERQSLIQKLYEKSFFFVFLFNKIDFYVDIQNGH